LLRKPFLGRKQQICRCKLKIFHDIGFRGPASVRPVAGRAFALRQPHLRPWCKRGKPGRLRTMPWQLSTAAIQMTAVANWQRNLAELQRLVGDAAAAGARLVVLPECFPFLGEHEGDKLAVAESLDGNPGPIRAALAQLAAQHGVWLVGGGMPESIAGDPRRTYNTAVVLDPRGELRARYRKIHLFDVDIPGGAVLRESDATAPGQDPVVIDIEGARVGLSICYDLRFPELYRELVLDHGAEVLLVPAAFTAHTGAAHWHLLLRSRAVENQAWLVAAAQAGQHNAKRQSYGHSMIIDPWGTVAAELAEGSGVVAARLDSELVTTRRRQMPCQNHVARWRAAPAKTP
jgi:deaminated glutathione amidase